MKVKAVNGFARILKAEGIPTKLVLQDTVGYGNAGPKADQLAATFEVPRKRR